ncbi:hypothetical protein [Sporomusa sp. KB1]|jgi:Leucine-rich repeat (LRR) protein|uniref:hypothetical protein n=1 Tax=Sporomusa sp. KB1 TaxID=943346 RepID=UPI0011A968E7|nr:hypothetical protein [Sporomusa sp. KB1]TWH47966.1 hypothetical protein Salpa_4094 [Sporomusa sp. KB1]
MGKIQGLDYYLQSFSCRDMIADKCVSLLQSDISGGRITKNDIDSLKDCKATEIWISGLTQDTFEYFIETYGHQFKIICFWKCPLIADFKKLETIINIEYLIFFWNQRVTHLWDLSKNSKLKGLSFDDFTRMHTLEEIPLAPSLEELYFGDKIWNKYILDSLTPLSRTKNLKTLIFSAKKINDNDITPLAKIVKLERLEFNGNLFSTEQIAWLTANTVNITSSVLEPYKKLKNPLKTERKTKDVLVIGKRKPFLNSQEDKVRLEKYEREFNDLVNKYRGNEWT